MPKNVRQSSGRKLVEEAVEVFEEVKKRKPDKEKLKAESADVVYRLFEAVRPYGVLPRHVLAELNRRAAAGECLQSRSPRKVKKKKNKH